MAAVIKVQNSLFYSTFFIISYLCLEISCINQRYLVTFINVNDCLRGANDPIHQYFDLSSLKCTPCQQNSQFQTQSVDGLSCNCRPGYYLTSDFGAGRVICAECPTNQVTSKDGWSCVACNPASPFNNGTKQCQPCSATTITVEQWQNGSQYPVPQSTPVRTCQLCDTGTSPNSNVAECQRCSQVLSMLRPSVSCDCPAAGFTGGMCFAATAYLPADTASLYTVTSTNGAESIESAYFKDNIRAAAAICNPTLYGNLTACQLLGNLCTLIYNSMQNIGRMGVGDACAQYDYLRGLTAAGTDWAPSMPWLFYTEQNADALLTDTVITTHFTLNGPTQTSMLNFRLAEYTLNGSFVGVVNATGGEIQLCKDSFTKLNAAYRFGTSYSHTCQLAVDDLWDRADTEMLFYDMYLEYVETSGQVSLYPIPVKVWNLRDRGGILANQGPRTNWQMTRRFFLVDNISTRTRVTSGTPPTSTLVRARLLRYVSAITIHVSLREGGNDGTIYPPYVDVQYADITSDSYGHGVTVATKFEVVYEASQNFFNYNLSIAMGTLCSLAAVFAMLRTWGWSRRAGKTTVEIMMLIKFFLFSCGAIGNIFFIVSFGAAFWFLIFYKNQSIVYLFIPTFIQEMPFVYYIAIGFVLKSIELMHLIASQCTLDIFFIDWERPRGRVTAEADRGDLKQAPVSIWRTYFVANEWNEIQTYRKTNPTLQIFAVVFFLYVVGFENLATADPNTLYSYDDTMYKSPYSRIFRYALAAAIYLIIYIIQYLFFVLFYERFIENKIQQYTDLCSVSNVSVFVMHHAQYGYYIHGRSVQGTADTGLREMHEALKREEADLCSQRGLLPNSDQQTFEMSLPRRLRINYNRIMNSMDEGGLGRAEKGGPTSATSSIAGTAVERSIMAYQRMTKLLSSFIDHSLKEIDYTIQNKYLLENILDVEFTDCTEKGLFYNDDGHSFDEVLFYGNESTLIVFDILLFCVVDLGAQNFVLAGVITYLIQRLVILIRESSARKNLSHKTLIDERFLI